MLCDEDGLFLITRASQRRGPNAQLGQPTCVTAWQARKQRTAWALSPGKEGRTREKRRETLRLASSAPLPSRVVVAHRR